MSTMGNTQGTGKNNTVIAVWSIPMGLRSAHLYQAIANGWSIPSFPYTHTRAHTHITHARTHTHYTHTRTHPFTHTHITHTHTHTHTHTRHCRLEREAFWRTGHGGFQVCAKTYFICKQTDRGGGRGYVCNTGEWGGGRSEFFVCFASLWCMFGVPCPWGVCVCVTESSCVRASSTNASHLKCCNRHNVTLALKNILKICCCIFRCQWAVMLQDV